MYTEKNVLTKDEGFVILLEQMGTDLSVVNAARVSFGKRKDLLEKKDEKLIKYLADHGHTSPFEHVTFTFHVKCPLFVRAQWFRHRTWSYNEISRRYTTENIEFYVPNEIRLQDNVENLQGSDGTMSGTQSLLVSNIIGHHSKVSFDLYSKLIEQGVANEMARMVLPQNMYTEFYATVNLHNLVKFLKLRMDSHAQWEIQQYANAMAKMVLDVVPISARALLGEQEVTMSEETVRVYAPDRSGYAEHKVTDDPESFVDCYLSGQIDEHDWQRILNERPEVEEVYKERVKGR